jgi:membrane-bound lytic murein transglycosylase D
MKAAPPSPKDIPLITDLARFDIAAVKDAYDIPLEIRPLVAQYIQFFKGPGRQWFRKWMSRSTRYIPVMQPILSANGVPKDTVYLAMIESGFSTQAMSWARASGPWQFIGSTGKNYGLKNDFWVDERRDPIKATFAAAKFLKHLYQELGHWYLSWAAYNAGPGKIRRMIDRRGSRDFWELSDGRGLADETKHYVPKLIACALVAKHPKAFGFNEQEFDYQPKMEFDQVDVPAPTDLEVLAKAANSTVQEISDLNPELKRWCTPPTPPGRPYKLRVPKTRGQIFARNYAKLPASERLQFKVHRVRKGDTLSGIAASYQSVPEAIMQINRLQNPRALRVNAELIIPVPSAARTAKESRPDATLERQVARAKRSGIASVRPEEEIPAGTQTKAVAAGAIKTVYVGGKTKVTYVVESGDSLWAIAQRFNCSVEDLRRWNGQQKAKRLQIGTVLDVWPAAAVEPGAKPAAR